MTNEEIAKECFLRRHAEWPCTKWDYTEWEELLDEVKAKTGETFSGEFYVRLYN